MMMLCGLKCEGISQVVETNNAMGVPQAPVFTLLAPFRTSVGTLAEFRGQNQTDMLVEVRSMAYLESQKCTVRTDIRLQRDGRV